jgi:hypothetical protein
MKGSHEEKGRQFRTACQLRTRFRALCNVCYLQLRRVTKHVEALSIKTGHGASSDCHDVFACDLRRAVACRCIAGLVTVVRGQVLYGMSLKLKTRPRSVSSVTYLPQAPACARSSRPGQCL